MSYLLAYNPYNTNLFMRSRSIDPAALAYFNATGISGSIEQQAINTLVEGLKADGLWSKMKAVYPFVTDNKNLLSYTNAFGNSYYITDGTSSFTVNNTTAPDGTNTGTRFTAIASNNNYFYSANTAQGQSFGTGNKAYSIYVKAGTFSGNVFLSITSDGNTQTTSATLTNEWQRITVTKNVIVAGNGSQYYIDLGGASMTSGQFFYIWGAQFENGTSATTYQPIATTQQAFISSQFKYNLVNPVDSDAAFRLVFNGGWTHSSNGATPNGTNGYADTKLVPSSVLSLNSSHISGYTRTNTSVLAPLLSSEDAGTYANGIFIWPKYSGNLFSVRVNDNSSDSATAVTNTQGLHLATRTASNVKKYRHNTTQILSNTTASSALNVASIYIGASRNNPNYSTHQTAFASIGDGLTDTEAAALYNAVNNYQVALSRNI